MPRQKTDKPGLYYCGEGADGRPTYTIVVSLGRDEQGRRRQHWETWHGSKREAERQRTAVLADVQAGRFLRPTRETVGGFLERWLRDFAKPLVRQTTYDSYEVMCRVHLTPAIGGLELSRLRATHLQRLYAEKMRSGLSSTTVRYIHAVISRALGTALRWSLIAVNPAMAVDPPRKRRREMRCWSPEEARQFLEHVAGDRLYALYALALMTGMRRGELLGLRWQDLDLEAGVVAVRQSLVHTSRGLEIQEPKTETSRRTIAISRRTAAILAHHRLAQAQERWFAGPGWQETGLVFARTDGQPVSPRGVGEQLDTRAQRAGVPRIRFHDLRHTHATALLAQGEHPKIVSERLGHSRIGETMDTYSHVLPTLQRQAAERAEELLLPPKR